MATYKDIQAKTGLSLSTISKYYNGLPVREKNSQAIQAAADELGFRVNGFARSLRSRKSLSVGVLLPDLENIFHLTIVAGVEAALRSDGISVLVCSSRPGPGDAVDFLMSKMVDGIIAVPTAGDVEALRAIAAQGMPVVTIDWTAPDLVTDSVVLDNVGAGAAVARHLVDHGHRRIAMVGGDPAVSTMRERAEGFRDALAVRGVELDDRLVTTGPLTAENGQAATERLLALPERPTALFSANYHLTLGALMAINDSGLRVPTDLSIVGFDSLELARTFRPRLTMFEQPTRAITDEAARLIRGRLNGEIEGQTQNMRLSGRLLVGASVASLHEHPEHDG